MSNTNANTKKLAIAPEDRVQLAADGVSGTTRQRRPHNGSNHLQGGTRDALARIMTITARYATICPCCSRQVAVGTKVTKVARGWAHVACASGGDAPATTPRPRDPSPSRKPSPRRPSRAPKEHRSMQTDERQIERKATGKAGGYRVGETLHAGKIPGGGGPDGCYWTVMHAFFARANEDNGQYDDLHCAYVRAATDEECAPMIVAGRSKLARATCEQWLVAQLAAGETVSDTGTLPADAVATITLGRKTGYMGTVTDGGTTYALTATSVVSHHGGHYDDYRSTTRTVARTDELALVIVALFADDGAALMVQADRIEEGR